MKKFLTIIIIVAVVFLISGGVVFGIGMANSNNELITNAIELTDDFNKIEINLDTANFKIAPTTDSTKKVEIKEKEKDLHKVSVNDNTLSIKCEDNRPWYKKFFDFNFKRQLVILYIPEGIYGNLNVNTSTGDIELPENFEFDNLKIEVSTGDINVNSKITNEIDVKASTGNINISNNNSIGNVKIETSTGDIKLNNLVGNNLNINTSTGDVIISNALFVNKLNIETSTGDVTINSSDFNEIRIETSTGDVDATFKTNKIIYAETSTGDTDYPHLTEGGICEIETSTGNIKVRIA